MCATTIPFCRSIPPRQSLTTDDDVYAAMSVWEDMLAAKATGDSEFTAMLTLWGAISTVAMRAKAFTIGRFANAVWSRLDQDAQIMFEPFDWKFVPALLRSIEFTTHGVLLPPVSTAAETMTAKAAERAAQYAHAVEEGTAR